MDYLKNNVWFYERAEVQPMPKSGVVKCVWMAVMPQFVLEAQAMSMTFRPGPHIIFFPSKKHSHVGSCFVDKIARNIIVKKLLIGHKLS